MEAVSGGEIAKSNITRRLAFGRDDVVARYPHFIAVGMALSGHPPHGSVLADFPHTALTSDVDVQNVRSDKDAESSASGTRVC